MPWPSGKGNDVQVSPVPFHICHHFHRLMIGLNIPVSAEREPDQSNRHQGGACYDQPIRIIHLSIPGSRSFSLPSPKPPAQSHGDYYHVFPDAPKSPERGRFALDRTWSTCSGRLRGVRLKLAARPINGAHSCTMTQYPGSDSRPRRLSIQLRSLLDGRTKAARSWRAELMLRRFGPAS